MAQKRSLLSQKAFRCRFIKSDTELLQLLKRHTKLLLIYELLLNIYLISNLGNFEQYSFEFGLGKPYLRQSSWPKLNFKEDSETFLI